MGTEGFEVAKKKALDVLDSFRVDEKVTRERLLNVAHTSLSTKVHHKMASQLTEIVVDAVLAIKSDNEPINLHMVEIMEMQHKLDCDTTLIKGLVMDHGARHPDMKKRVENAFILTCNVSMEYEKSEVNAGFFYKSAEEREKLVEAERRFTNDKVNKIIQLKKEVCDGSGDGEEKGFVVINQKGIDPMSLDMLAKAGIVYEHVLGESKFTFVEKCANPKSVTIMINGPNKHTITQIKDAVRDGLRAVKNAIEDDCVVPGAGGFQIKAYDELMKFKPSVKGRAQLGVQAFADAMLVIPKVLAQNAGLDPQECIVKLQQEYASSGIPVGLDLVSGEPISPADAGIFDNYCVMKQLLNSCTIIASNLLLVDEMMRAGMATLKG